MAKTPINQGKTWTTKDIGQLKSLAKGNTPTRVIGIKLGRTPVAIQNKASDEKISLNPPNRSPYGRKK